MTENGKARELIATSETTVKVDPQNGWYLKRFAAIMICAVGFVIEVVGMSPIAIFLEATGALEAHEAFLHGLEIILSCVCKVSFIVAVLLAFAAYKARWEL